jgi:GxGYxYP putative glycoside hydrolase C-terminal domain
MLPLGGVPASISQSQPQVPTPKLEKKIYLTFTFSEGDNLQYDQHRLRTIWDDPNRGTVPLNWSISPLLVDAAPIMLHYYQSTQTPNDLLIAGPSGAGYTYPGDWPAASLSTFTKRTGQYMARAGLTLIDALNVNSRGSNADLTNKIARNYSRNAHPLGVLCNWRVNSSTLQKLAGLPVISQAFITSVAQGQNAAALISDSWTGHHPLFAAILVYAWNMTPTDVNTLAVSLGSQFEIVRGDVFFDLIRKH